MASLWKKWDLGRICRIQCSVWRSEAFSVLAETIKMPDNCKWYLLAGEQQADEETEVSESVWQYIRRKQRKEPSVKQKPSLSFKGTGGALNKQYNKYILLSIFVLYIERGPLHRIRESLNHLFGRDL